MDSLNSECLDQKMNTANISGSYQLFKYGYFKKSDENFEPISDFYSGEIHYMPNGHMSVVLRFAEEPTEFSEIVAYAGTYRIEGDTIQHEVTTSVRPDYEGQHLTRTFSLVDGVLTTIFEDTPEFRKMAFWKKM